MLNYLEYPELIQLLEAAKIRSPKFEAMLALMAYTGLRLNEALSLPLAHVLQDGKLRKQFYVLASSNKPKKSREAFIPAPLADILERYLFYRGRIKIPSDLLFPSPRGTKMSFTAVEKRVKNLGLKILGRRVTPHSLRHTFGTLLARTAPIRVVQEALGHLQLSSTQIYTHVTRQDIERAVGVAFDPTPPKPIEVASPLKKAVTEAFESPL